MTALMQLARLTRPAYRVWSRLSRGITLGVRGLVLNADGQVLLVEHTYIPGWFLPGGGVEPDETAGEALAREMEEEAGLRLTMPPRLISVHDNSKAFRGDHVLVFVCGDFVPCPPRSAGEIANRQWFDPANLPEGTTAGTRARISEVVFGAPPSPRW